MPQINVGFIGLSKSGWASTALAPPLLQNDKYSLKAISTSSKESAEASAADYTKLSGHEVKAYHGNTDQIANDPDVNLVAVAVNVRSHKETLTPVLEAGKDFFIEWPAGKTTAETVQFAEAAKAKGLRSLVGLQGWQSPVIKKIKEIIASGKIGKVMSSTIIALIPGENQLWGPETTINYLYILTPDGGATMLDIPIGHLVGSVTHVLGDFKSVSATTAILYPTSTVIGLDKKPTGETITHKVPDHIAFSGILDSGALVNVVCRAGYKSTKGRQQFIWEIDGEEGSIRVTDEEINSAFIHSRDPKVYLNGELVELVASGLHGYVGAAWDEFAKGEEGVYPTIDDAVKLHRLLDAIRESGENGKRIDL